MYTGSFVVPSSPLLIPGLAQRQATDLSITLQGITKLVEHLTESRAQTVVLLCALDATEHDDSAPVHLFQGQTLEATLVPWGAPDITVQAIPDRHIALRFSHEVRSVLGNDACVLSHAPTPPHDALFALSVCMSAQIQEVLIVGIRSRGEGIPTAIARILADHIQSDARRIAIGICASVSDMSQKNPEEYSSEEHMVSAALEGFYSRNGSVADEESFLREHIQIQDGYFAVLDLLQFHRACMAHVPATTQLLSTEHPLGEGFLVALYTPPRAV